MPDGTKYTYRVSDKGGKLYSEDVARWMNALPSDIEAKITNQNRDEQWDGREIARLERDGATLPWRKMRDTFRLRDGEVTAWIGPNNDGKSLITGYLAAVLALRGIPTLMISLEMPLLQQVERLTSMLLGKHRNDATQEERMALKDAVCEYHSWVDHLGSISVPAVLGLIHWAVLRGEFRHIFLDNITMVAGQDRETDARALRLISSAKDIARATGAHIHVVGHVRKPDGSGRYVNRYDWRGAGIASDIVDNIVVIQRNPKRAIDDDGRADPNDESPTHIVTVDKQRNGGTGRFRFWLHPQSLRFMPARYCTIHPYDDPQFAEHGETI